MEYEEFIRSKATTIDPTGIERGFDINPKLFPFQRDTVAWAVRKGRDGIFLDCGLGKTPVQLEYARLANEETNKPILVVAPLAVSKQTIREGKKFDVPVNQCRSKHDVKKGVNITNYEMIQHFDPSEFGGVVLDECFPRGTLIDTILGQKRIETIRKGDKILNASGIDVVADIHRREVQYGVKLRCGGKEITSSPNHPFFTQRGWVSAQDLEPGDAILQTRAAVRMVQDELSSASVPGVWTREVLWEILFSEMAHEAAAVSSECSYAGSRSEKRAREKCVVRCGKPEGNEREGANLEFESNVRSDSPCEGEPDIENHEAQTFRAWRKRANDADTSENHVGCTRQWMGSRIEHIVGRTDSRLSILLQAGLRKQRSQSRYRSGWKLSLQPKRIRHEEGCKAGFIRLDSLEVLEQGHPELERLRSPDGKLYFYDIGATRHPSFSVEGLLVHNSSILKAFMGKTKRMLCDMFEDHRFKLACSATPAPNDYLEIGNHAQFLSVMPSREMISRFFINDAMEAGNYRLKAHGAEAFWRWLASWGVFMRKPSDIGYQDEGFELPELNEFTHVMDMDSPLPGELFSMPANTLAEQRGVKRQSLVKRCEAVAGRVNESKDPWAVWCELNDEGDMLEDMIPDAVQVAGSDSIEDKEDRIEEFSTGKARVIISKASITGFGLNWQHCNNTAITSISHSYEDYYQVIRRFYRFGQRKPVNVHRYMMDVETPIIQNLERKKIEADTMLRNMILCMADVMKAELGGIKLTMDGYGPALKMETPTWMR